MSVLVMRLHFIAVHLLAHIINDIAFTVVADPESQTSQAGALSLYCHVVGQQMQR